MKTNKNLWFLGKNWLYIDYTIHVYIAMCVCVLFYFYDICIIFI